jgi:hypothetical protein
MKNSNDTIEIRTRDLPACSAVPQPTVPPRAPHSDVMVDNWTYVDIITFCTQNFSHNSNLYFDTSSIALPVCYIILILSGTYYKHLHKYVTLFFNYAVLYNTGK